MEYVSQLVSLSVERTDSQNLASFLKILSILSKKAKLSLRATNNPLQIKTL